MSAVPRLGFGLPVSGSWATPATMRRVARRAEELGYASLWTFQRTLSPVDGSLGPAHRAVLDPVVALAHVAGHTERIGLGTATVCAPFTAPALLAKSMASLDVVSGGRLTVGLGIGWLPEEYTAAGVPFARRGARMEEYLRCLHALWTQDPVEFAGEFYTVPRSHVGPPPVQRPHPPVLLGGTAVPALRRAGRLAEGWIGSSTHDLSRIGEYVASVHDGAREVGRDPRTLRILVRAVVDLLDADPGPARRPFQGTRAQVLDDVRALGAQGVTEVFVDLNLSPRVVGPEVEEGAALAYAERVLDALAPSERAGTAAPVARRVVIAPDSFKGTATATDAAAALADGWRAVHPGDEVLRVPLADGGEGTLEALAAGHRDATWHTVEVSGPDSARVMARWLGLADGTAVVELAESSGLARMTTLDPLGADTRGLGEVIAAVLPTRPRRLVVGLGGSAGTDGGTGCLAALGARFEDHGGRPLGRGGGALVDLARVDLSGLPPPPPEGVVCLTDVTAPLLGPDGAATVFGPQKGAGASEVDQLERGLSRLAGLLGGSPESPGAGAAGGTAFGLQAAWGAVTTPGAPYVAASTGLPDVVQHARLVVTGEGRFDRTSLSGKVVGHLVELVGGACPVVVVAGQVAAPPPPGVSSVLSLADLAGDTAAAQQDPQRWLREAGSLLAREAVPVRRWPDAP